MLVNHEYYETVYLGENVTSLEFPKYYNQAYEYVEYITMNRVNQLDMPIEVTNKVKRSICVAIDLLKQNDVRIKSLREGQQQGLQSGIKSESIKSHSVTLAEYDESMELKMTQTNDKLIYQQIKKILMPTGLLYRGL